MGEVAADVGCVVIGRNEGERLRCCLSSILSVMSRVVYVDSGSTDGSVGLAKAMGVLTLNLDLSIPFTAARARNEGFQVLLQQFPDLELVQFVDGDCELVSGWIEVARRTLRADAKLAVVCGRRRERRPDASVYNALCEIEWDTPVGAAKSCGGDALMRVQALQEVAGFNPGLIAGEEPELCLRLRRRAWKIVRIDADMTLHDAAMLHWSQWWKRNVRCGYAYAQGAFLHGGARERYRVRETIRVFFWVVGLPAFILGTALPTRGLSTLLASGYVLCIAGIYARTRRRGHSRSACLTYALFVTLGQLPELQGVLRFAWMTARGQRSRLIEYK